MAVATKRKAPRARKLTGIQGAPLNQGWENFKFYFHYEVDRRDVIKLLKEYVKKTYSRSDAAAINAVPDYKFAVVCHMAAAIRWMELGNDFPSQYKKFPEAIKVYFDTLKEEGAEILKAKKAVEDADAKKYKAPVLSPAQRVVLKTNDTIMCDLDAIEDEWLEGKSVKEFDVYTKLTEYDLKGPIPVRMVKDWCQFNIEDLEAGDGYEIKAAERKRRIKLLKQIIADADKFGAAAKAARKPKARKPKAADAKVKSLKFMKDSIEYKLKSVNPVSIPQSVRLYAFNTRTRELTEFVAAGPDGLDVKGTSILNYDEKLSRKTKLRKPEEFLGFVMKKTPRQMDNEWKKLNTKVAPPNSGRIGPDVILVKVATK